MMQRIPCLATELNVNILIYFATNFYYSLKQAVNLKCDIMKVIFL